jgi:hypothetical protein
MLFVNSSDRLRNRKQETGNQAEREKGPNPPRQLGQVRCDK